MPDTTSSASHTLGSITREAIEVNDLLAEASPPGLRVVRITSDPAVASSHIYMESQVFTPDGTRFIFQRVEPTTQELMMREWRRTYWLCDLSDGFALRQITDEPDAVAPSVSPDGRYVYYFLSQPDPRDAARRGVELRRISLDTFERESVAHLPAASRVYPLSSMRSDGLAISAGVFLGDGHRPGTHALAVFDIQRGTAQVIFSADHLINPHPQYARGTDPAYRHEILVQHNRAVTCDEMGNILACGPGCTLSVMRDDGSRMRQLPCGLDEHGKVRCHGHQEWRGNHPSVIVGIDTTRDDGVRTRPIYEVSIDEPMRVRDITAAFDLPLFGHTAFDPTGTFFVGDWRPVTGESNATQLLVGSLGDRPGDMLTTQYLLHPRSSYGMSQIAHPHPFLSPDAKRAFFNSDFGGRPQIWMVEGFSI